MKKRRKGATLTISKKTWTFLVWINVNVKVIILSMPYNSVLGANKHKFCSNKHYHYLDTKWYFL
jgi:hypothetical protein